MAEPVEALGSADIDGSCDIMSSLADGMTLGAWVVGALLAPALPQAAKTMAAAAVRTMARDFTG
jgi:hypothetical protein